MKNKDVYLKSYIVNNDKAKADQDTNMIYGSKSKTQKNRYKNNVDHVRMEIKGFIRCLVE